MKKYLKSDEWSIIEEGFDAHNHKSSESIFSIGNGYMGQRANFEERYSGKTLQGSYIAGVYYPDKTRVGWWKNGYPEYFAKVLNSPNFIGIDVQLNNEYLDISHCKVSNFRRELNMREGYLNRSFNSKFSNGSEIRVNTTRFISRARKEIAAIKYAINSVNLTGELLLTPYIDGDVKNEDSNYNEKFWNILNVEASGNFNYLECQTKKLDFVVGFGSIFTIEVNGNKILPEYFPVKGQKYSGTIVKINVKPGDTVVLCKYISVFNSLNHHVADLYKEVKNMVNTAATLGYEKLFSEHREKWENIWQHSDIQIKGDMEAQQGIRFNIFHLNQTYTGEDERLNIGPKGFTGEKYGGSTYWDTEAYCIPFFVSTASPEVTRKLLIYRYKHLERAIENARKLGFDSGAALYPMVTMNGEECHNEWEITFEEIHRNGAIAYAIYNYILHTSDVEYLAEYGLEVLIGISRFWSQRVNFSAEKGKYVILGVTGPNEYENNVNNNWYTNTMAQWCLQYTIEAIETVEKTNSKRAQQIFEKIHFHPVTEISKWKDIIEKMHFPYDEKHGVFLQQDGFMDKEQILVKDLDPAQRPINQKWSWDRILRSCFIKQADTLQGMYLFQERYDLETLKKHFEFYEGRTVHESSLSPCVHVILAALIGNMEKAYELYLRTSRLDIDDYNHEVHEGLHITSMAGTWMSIVEGFGGKRVTNGLLSLFPQIPDKWSVYSFKLLFHNVSLIVTVSKKEVKLQTKCGDLSILLYNQPVYLKDDELQTFPLKFK